MSHAAEWHRIWPLGDDVDTDALAPGAYMQLGIEGIAPHCLEPVPAFAARGAPGDVIVAGRNFGIGSSREQAAAVLVHLGVAAVIAPSVLAGCSSATPSTSACCC
jgi:3-isopropylmalate/(R)-2-methylmalate dehydratase small subunit